MRLDDDRLNRRIILGRRLASLTLLLVAGGLFRILRQVAFDGHRSTSRMNARKPMIAGAAAGPMSKMVIVPSVESACLQATRRKSKASMQVSVRCRWRSGDSG